MPNYQVLCYTRIPEEDAIYSAKLAYSMHLAVKMLDSDFEVLNHNAGVLYAKATQNEDGTLNRMSLKNPWIFEKEDGSYGVIAQRIKASVEEDDTSKGKLLYFESKDLLEYKEMPLLDLPESEFIEDASCEYINELGTYRLYWKNSIGKCYELDANNLSDISDSVDRREVDEINRESIETTIKGAVTRNVIEVPKHIAVRIQRKLTVPENVANEVPKSIIASTEEDVKNVKALARYSDGSTVEKPVKWNLENVDFNMSGSYLVTGEVDQKNYEFPIAINRADPCVGKWNGKYYFIATNDADKENTMYIREADSLAGLVDAPESLILDTKTYPHIGNLLWAPEFHVIKGKLYIFHAATPGNFREEQCHVMMLKENGNPLNASDWTMPIRVLKKDGSFLYGKEGITLDMTVFEIKDRYYAMWSQRQFEPVDQGAWIYLAEINPDEPWKLISDPVLVSMPDYGWANNRVFVDEGPYALITEKKLFVTFSSSLVDSTYVVGLLSADLDADLLEPDNWTKCNYPIMSCRTKEGETGTGHNAYVQDDDGLTWNIYHARTGVEGPRCTGFRRVHFDTEGYPLLELTQEKDLKLELAKVEMLVVVKEKIK
ncbi:family 43 glycosylhydrolase [Anaerosporobacter sp.]|uniref:family 43 glycosylhydrolase n=1 Tax=Anaerosporobacter sp. TaxID=1872529 RepID=UPI00286EDE0F|nr:family 43 glycosylhydrolase [Anaerosporobacter sp.]